eukprot:TRINITY_DN67988_c0_g1_i1.p1 TRINITY_DN67988_c0_g1~~TRINITY_DN67988_c0_g1_i1.p1  ORF type:complete len:239 (+),score=33.21 TRINITY_DN67988_c0_g1_i1:590-1306(+)
MLVLVRSILEAATGWHCILLLCGSCRIPSSWSFSWMVHGSDMLFGGCDEGEMLEMYQKIVMASRGATVVYGAEFGLWPGELSSDDGVLQQYRVLRGRRSAVLRTAELNATQLDALYRCPSGHCRASPSVRPHYQHLNAGWVMGPVRMLRKIYHGKSDLLSDQLHATRYMMEHPDEVTLDYTGSLVLNLAELAASAAAKVVNGHILNQVTQRTQCFVHGNGSGKERWRAMLRALHEHYM